MQFKYEGYDDTTCALIYGKLYIGGKIDNNGKSHLTPLANVKIQVEQTNPAAFTDEKGNFIMGFNKGIFRLLITKSGYQSLRIINYVSIPDQVSSMMAILEIGKEQQIFDIPALNEISN